jgi:hypothetical protein
VYTAHGAPLLVLLGIPAIAVVVAALVVVGWQRAGGRALPAAGIAVLWFALFGALAGTGYLGRTVTEPDLRPPPFLIVLVLIVVGALALSVSPIGRRFATLPVAALVGLQAFRLPLELVMHEAATAGVMPPQMTFTGWNFDVVTGATTIAVARLAAHGRAPRALLLAWNAMGLVLVVTIAAIGVASSPAFAAFGGERFLNTWIFYVPFVYLPGVLVLVAVAGHVVLFRKLKA